MPFVFVVNAPAGSEAHAALLRLLHFMAEEKEQYAVARIILMGAAVEAVTDPKIAMAYAEVAQQLDCSLFLCGMSAKNHHLVDDHIPQGFTLTGFMDILSIMHKHNEFKVINW